MALHCTQCGDSLTADARFCPACGTPVVAVATAAKDPLLGQVVADRYVILDKLGQGRSGAIYRAEHNTLHRKMAVKVLHERLSRDDAAVERFRREATTIGQIDNDHLLQIFDFGRTADHRLFFAMELLEGETLDEVLARTPQLDPERATKILRQIAEALAEAHERGYIHRDLRPRNVFLSMRRGDPDFVKLLDFGLAKLVLPDVEQKQTALGITFGDARYMSPEQTRGDAIDARSDVYAIGVVGFQMLTGQVPFTGKGPFEVLQKVLSSDAPRVRSLRADCPPWLDEMIARCLRRDPADRFASMPELLQAMERRATPRAEPSAEVPPNDAEDDVTEPHDTTNPGKKPRGFAATLIDPPRERHDTVPDSVSGEVHALPHTAQRTDTGPSIVVDASFSVLHGEPTGPQRPSAIQGARVQAEAPSMLTAELPTADLSMRGESTGPQRVSGDDGWFKAGVPDELEPAVPRSRGPAFIAAIAGGVAVVGIAIVALWPHPHPQDPPSRAIAQAPATAPPTTPTTTPIPPAPTPTPTPAPTPVIAQPVAAPSPPAAETATPTSKEPEPVAKTKPVAKSEPKSEAVARSEPKKPKPSTKASDLMDPFEGKARPAEKPRAFVDPFAGTAKGGQADALVKQGRARIANGDMSQAQAAFNQARQLDPKNADAVAGLAEVSFESGEYGNAAAMLRQALRLSPNRARFLVLLGESYYKMNRPREAIGAYRQALKVDPANQEAQRSLQLAQKKLSE